MTYRQVSIKQRLLILLMGGLCAISAIMFFEARSSARTAANEAYDRALLGSALAILERVLVVGDKIEVDIPHVALEMLVTDHQDRIYYQVETQGGEFLTGYNNLPALPSAAKAGPFAPTFYDGVYKGKNIRIGMVQDYVSSPEISTRVIVKVAETTDARDALIAKMVQNAVMRQFILIMVAGLIMWIGISWGFKPLIRLQQSLNRRNPDELHPIQHNVPIEVQSLVGAINNLMERLSESMASMRRFTSNAAHQLRTPLAAIQTQTELALKTQNIHDLHDRFEHLKRSTQQSTRLINQLLSLARIGPNETGSTLLPLDLVVVAQKVTMELVPHALENDMDLGFEHDQPTAMMSGNEALLFEATKNLIENAINYCPKKSEITVKVFHHAQQICLEVQDNGPGIEPELQEAIFERFNRGHRNDGDGCGLGLSIVKEIVERHYGHLTLDKSSPRGATFRMTFPK